MIQRVMNKGQDQICSKAQEDRTSLKGVCTGKPNNNKIGINIKESYLER